MTSDCHHAFDPVNLCCALCGIPLRQARMKNGWELLFSSDKPKDTEMTPCPDCKGTGKYQPLMGPPEPCRTCSPPVFSNEDQAMSLASVQDIAEERAAAESVLEQYVRTQACSALREAVRQPEPMYLKRVPAGFWICGVVGDPEVRFATDPVTALECFVNSLGITDDRPKRLLAMLKAQQYNYPVTLRSDDDEKFVRAITAGPRREAVIAPAKENTAWLVFVTGTSFGDRAYGVFDEDKARRVEASYNDPNMPARVSAKARKIAYRFID